MREGGKVGEGGKKGKECLCLCLRSIKSIFINLLLKHKLFTSRSSVYESR
jgi:hypothetical protein